MNTQLSRKERERIAKREAILDAARQVFSERGFGKATLDEIAEVAEFGKGTLYNYFKNKEELFVSVIIRGIHRFRIFVENALKDKSTPREKLETYVDASFIFFEEHRQLFSILHTERNNLARSLNDDMFHKFHHEETSFTHYLSIIFDEGIKAGQFKCIDPSKLAEALFGMIHFAIIHDVREPATYNLHNESAFIKRIFFEGVAKPKESVQAKQRKSYV